MCCARNTLTIRLKGRGVNPVISLSIPDGVLDLGDALVNDTVTSTFQVTTVSKCDIIELANSTTKAPLSVFSDNEGALLRKHSKMITYISLCTVRLFQAAPYKSVRTCLHSSKENL